MSASRDDVDRQFIIGEIKRLATESGGPPPGKEKFYRETGSSPAQMTGAELVERLDVSHPHLNVLFTTDSSDEALEQTLIDFERPILIKPNAPRELLHGIREILDVSKYPRVAPRAG